MPMAYMNAVEKSFLPDPTLFQLMNRGKFFCLSKSWKDAVSILKQQRKNRNAFSYNTVHSHQRETENMPVATLGMV
jgi:hypothetical protein